MPTIRTLSERAKTDTVFFITHLYCLGTACLYRRNVAADIHARAKDKIERTNVNYERNGGERKITRINLLSVFS